MMRASSGSLAPWLGRAQTRSPPSTDRHFPGHTPPHGTPARRKPGSRLMPDIDPRLLEAAEVNGTLRY